MVTITCFGSMMIRMCKGKIQKKDIDSQISAFLAFIFKSDGEWNVDETFSFCIAGPRRSWVTAGYSCGSLVPCGEPPAPDRAKLPLSLRWCRADGRSWEAAETDTR